MAVSSGNSTSLFAGLGAFAVVVGGLAAYKHLRPSKHTNHRSDDYTESDDDNRNAGPDPEVVELAQPPSEQVAVVGETRTVTAGELMLVDVTRASKLLGTSVTDVRAAYGTTAVSTGRNLNDDVDSDTVDTALDVSTYRLRSMWVGYSGNYTANIGFEMTDDDDARVRSVIVTTDGNDASTAKHVIDAADLTWGKPTIKRDWKHGIALVYRANGIYMIAEHRSDRNTWIFTISKTDDTGDLLGIGNFAVGGSGGISCDRVGRKPSQLGNGKLFSIGQSTAAALKAANQMELSHSLEDNVLHPDSGIQGFSLAVYFDSDRVSAINYSIDGDNARDEFKACWAKPDATDAEALYWRAGNNRILASNYELDISPIRSLPSVFKEFASAVNKHPDALNAIDEVRSIPNIPDWFIESDIHFAQDDSIELQLRTITSIDVHVAFQQSSDRRMQIANELIKDMGAGKLQRDNDGAPTLRFTRNRVVFDLRQLDAHRMTLSMASNSPQR
jgi:hypothetical protein